MTKSTEKKINPITLLEELIEGQKKKVLACGQRIIPHVTSDDLLQPNDFPALENHPHFRYEEGVLEGLLSAKMALLAYKKDHCCCSALR